MLQMGSVSDNTSGGAYAYRASKCGLNMGVLASTHFPCLPELVPCQCRRHYHHAAEAVSRSPCTVTKQRIMAGRLHSSRRLRNEGLCCAVTKSLSIDLADRGIVACLLHPGAPPSFFCC